MLSNHLILCHHLLLLPSIFPSFRQVTETNSSHLNVQILHTPATKMCRYYILYKKDDTAKHQERTGTTKWKDPRTKVTLLSLARKQSEYRQKQDSPVSSPYSITGSCFQKRAFVTNTSFLFMIKSYSVFDLPASPLHFPKCCHQSTEQIPWA